MLSGMLAALERLVNANVSTGQILRKKRSGLIPAADTSKPCTTNIRPRPRYETTTKLPSLMMSCRLEPATTLVISASTPYGVSFITRRTRRITQACRVSMALITF
ncbi:hypothetical protein D3C74_409990 [compost metagenome]